jgi:hypothetical protein
VTALKTKPRGFEKKVVDHLRFHFDDKEQVVNSKNSAHDFKKRNHGGNGKEEFGLLSQFLFLGRYCLLCNDSSSRRDSVAV